ncbi:methyl-accepting chemotaxis protein [Planctobacterium marinum]|uniref:methyl-accepting chemotaxis protein n=1 Tax=Planctobacterium marinum TaxID=1631968 RepID=UPI001E3ED306|nr:HAMP domain-containing methyl-accepting chemotaxis protein [Planctobacterium marinum]MCC2607459.1 HAMP domain-containing methyl-accepting chemotaxis protein [Planctobacterium marinum]
MLKNLRIYQKIYLQGFLQFLTIFLIGVVAIFQMNKLGAKITEIAKEDIPLTRLLTKVTEHQLEQAIFLERVFFKATLVNMGYLGAEEEFKKNVKLVTEYQTITENELKKAALFTQEAISNLNSEDTTKEYQIIFSKLKLIQLNFENLKIETKNALQLAHSGQINEMIKQASVVEKIEDKIDHEVVMLLDSIQSFTQESATQAESVERLAIKMIVGIFIVALLISVLLPFVVSRSIVVPINSLLSRLKNVSEGDGDLRLRLDENGKDETGDVARAFNKFMILLNKVIKGVSTQADELGQLAEEGLRAMDATLKNVETQHLETEMVATAVEEMSANTQEVARSTNEASVVAETVKEKVASGQQTAREARVIIEQLADQVQDASNVIASLVAETDSIGTVTDTIQSIAEQTNLLALNAAIEAARAGESGRGFAVVADEVRSLAQRTRESTINIQELVQRLQTESANAVESMAKGKSSTAICLTKGEDTAKAFVEAANAVNQISDLNTQVAAASEQQAQVAQEVNKTLMNITQIAEETAVGARQTSVANENIAKRLIELRTNINIFKTS